MSTPLEILQYFCWTFEILKWLCQMIGLADCWALLPLRVQVHSPIKGGLNKIDKLPSIEFPLYYGNSLRLQLKLEPHYARDCTKVS